MKAAQKKVRQGDGRNPRYHNEDELEYIRSEIVDMFEFHERCGVGRCRRSGICLQPRIRPPRGLDVENFDVYHNGLPYCVAEIG